MRLPRARRGPPAPWPCTRPFVEIVTQPPPDEQRAPRRTPAYDDGHGAESEPGRCHALPGRCSVVESHVMLRCRILLAALAGSALLAVGFAVGVDRLVVSSPQAPHLTSIPDASLSARYGVTLAAAPQAPYCGLEQTVAETGWLSPGTAGCAISRERAEAAALGVGSGRVIESLLARVSSTWNPEIRDHLAWLVVVRWARGASVPRWCGTLVYPAPAGCYSPQTRVLADRVVVMDAFSGQPLQTQQFSPGLIVGPPLSPRG